MTIDEIRDLIDQNIKTNSNRISPDKTTGTMLKKVLNELVNVIDKTSSAGSDDRYHTKVYGEIKLYWGNYYALPKGWVICDGFNGTPDMRGKVPVGWSNGWQSGLGEPDLSDYQHIGRMGGLKKVTLEDSQVPSHNHGGTLSTSTAGAHIHGFNNDQAGGDGGGGYLVAGDTHRNQSLANAHTASAGNHSHSVTIPSFGGGAPHENRQPYLVMMYIMYVGDTVAPNEKVQWAEYDATTGVKVKEGDSNHKYGFRYVSPAFFSNLDPNDYTLANQTTGDVISNIGFIPENDPARPLEKWLQLVSLGDNLGDDTQSTI